MDKEKVVMFDSDEAAHVETRTGWVSRHGRFCGDDERTARWDGCTHEVCSACGEVILRSSLCRSCRMQKEWEKWLKAERAPYDGNSMLYSEARDTYFVHESEAKEYAEDEGCDIDSLRLYICEPVYGRPIDQDYFVDELPEDGEVPDLVWAAMDDLNRAIHRAGPLSWRAGAKVPSFADVDPLDTM